MYVVLIGMGEIVISVFIYLGIFFIVGFLFCWILIKKKGKKWYEEKFIFKISLIILVVLLFIIVVMFFVKGEKVIEFLMDVVRIVILLFIYFVFMFFVLFFIFKCMGISYLIVVLLLFIVVSNNFELVIVVVVGVFGINLGEVFVVVIGLLVEVLVLIGLVNVVLKFK